MPNPYGTQGSPAIGRGLPGLPRRSTQAAAPLTPLLSSRWGIDNANLPFPPRADWSQGMVTHDLTITGIPTNFQLAGGQTWNGGGIALSSGEAFLLPFKLNTAEDYVGLFLIAGNVVTLLDYEVLPANYATNDGRVLHFYRTEWPDTFLLSWAGQNAVANCASRVYVLKADPGNARLDVLPDVAVIQNESASNYNRKVWVHYLKDGYVLAGGGHFSSAWTNGSSRLCKITPTGLTILGSSYESSNPLFVSPVDAAGRFVAISRGSAETNGDYSRVIYQLGNDVLTSLDNDSLRSSNFSLQSSGGYSQAGLRGSLCWFYEGASYPFVLSYLGEAYAQSLAAPGLPNSDAFPGTMFLTEGGADGALFCTSETTRRLFQYLPFADSPGAWRYQPQFIASLGTSSYQAVHLGNRIFSMQSNGTLGKLYNANKLI